MQPGRLRAEPLSDRTITSAYVNGHETHNPPANSCCYLLYVEGHYPCGARQLARIARAGDLAKSWIDLGAGWIKTRRSVYTIELRVIERVVQLPTELQPEIFRQRDVLEQREIPVVKTRSSEHILRRIPGV